MRETDAIAHVMRCLQHENVIHVANCDIPLKQAKGLSSWTHDGRSAPLNVSAGCGHSIYAPVRFACRPEATLLTLSPRA